MKEFVQIQLIEEEEVLSFQNDEAKEAKMEKFKDWKKYKRFRSE